MWVDSCLRVAVAAFFLGSLGGHMMSAAGIQVQQGSSRSAAAHVKSPVNEVIGSHLAGWVKQGKEAKATAPGSPRSVPNETVPNETASSVHVAAPAFVEAPFLPLAGGAAGLGNEVAADVNNDGKTDFVIVGNNGAISVFLNPGSFSNIASAQPLAANTAAVSKNVSISQLVAADLNGDGNVDLIGLDEANSQIIVWLGNGDGTFAADVDYSVAPSSGATWANAAGGLAVADFNGDGKLDVATVEVTPYSPNPQTTITELTFLNQGNGVLAAGKEVDTAVTESFAPELGATVVVSADGKTASGVAFLLTDTGYGSGGTYVYNIASNGDGSFTAPVKPSAPLISSTGESTLIATNLTSPTTGGPLGAGLPTTDLVIVAGDGAIYDAPYTGQENPTSASVLVGAPDNLSSSTNLFPTSAGSLPLPPNAGVVAADFDHDGYLDLLTTTAATAYVFLNNGKGAFTRAPAQVTGGSAGHVVAADFDNSGYPSFLWNDVILPQLGYYQNLGAKSSAQAGLFNAAPSVGGPSTNGGTSYNAFAGDLRVQAVADVNGDGLTDVIATDASYVYRDGLTVHPGSDIVLGLNNGAGAGSNEAQGFTFTTVISGSALSTLGLDPFLEPITIKTSAGTSLLIATAADGGLYTIGLDAKGVPGTPQALSYASTTPLCGMYYADAGDVNGDGKADIVTAYPGDYICTGQTPGAGAVSSGFFTFLGNGDGTFQPGQYSAVGSSLYKVKLVNLTGTAGMTDVVAIDSYTPVSRFGPGPSSSAGIYDTYVVPGNGDGTFAVGSASDAAPGYIVSDAILGDFNQDGIQDLTLTTEGQYNSTTKQMVPATAGVLLMAGNGDRTFGAGQLVDQEIYPGSGSYADVNGDGTPDLIVTQYTGVESLNVPMVEIFPNLGGGVFGPPYSAMVAPFNWITEGRAKEFGAPVFTGAFGKTGSTDVLISNGYDSSLFINQGPPALQVTASSTAATQGSSVTLTASLQQGGNTIASATGAVIFSLNGTVLGTSEVTDGSATLTVAPPVGSDAISAAYSGDANNNPATGSVTVTVTALAPTFTMSASSGSMALAAGASGATTLTLTSNASFSGTVSFTCSGLPAEASCTVTPSTLSLAANQTATVVAVIATTPKNNSFQASIHTSGGFITASGISSASLLFLFLRRRRNSPAWKSLTLVVFAVVLMATMSGCSSSSDKYPGTPSGASNVVITATSGTISVSQTIALTVTQ
jgi:hypothetical protein